MPPDILHLLPVLACVILLVAVVILLTATTVRHWRRRFERLPESRVCLVILGIGVAIMIVLALWAAHDVPGEGSWFRLAASLVVLCHYFGELFVGIFHRWELRHADL